MNSTTKKLLFTSLFAIAMAPKLQSAALASDLANHINNLVARVSHPEFAGDKDALMEQLTAIHGRLSELNSSKAESVLKSIKNDEISLTLQLAQIQKKIDALEEDAQADILLAERDRLDEALRVIAAENRRNPEEGVVGDNPVVGDPVAGDGDPQAPVPAGNADE